MAPWNELKESEMGEPRGMDDFYFSTSGVRFPHIRLKGFRTEDGAMRSTACELRDDLPIIRIGGMVGVFLA